MEYQSGPVQGFRREVTLDGSSADAAATVRRLRLPHVFPEIVCLCGSTRFWRQFQEQSLRLTMEGKIVLSIGAARAPDDADKTFGGFIQEADFEAAKEQLDELHKRKIDLADSVFVLNVGGYIGASTRSEVVYALKQGKHIACLEPEHATAHELGIDI